eukprot:COSAG01_NODE_3758_length_5723_cov_19.616110_4_plen_193_part_00
MQQRVTCDATLATDVNTPQAAQGRQAQGSPRTRARAWQTLMAAWCAGGIARELDGEAGSVPRRLPGGATGRARAGARRAAAGGACCHDGWNHASAHARTHARTHAACPRLPAWLSHVHILLRAPHQHTRTHRTGCWHRAMRARGGGGGHLLAWPRGCLKGAGINSPTPQLPSLSIELPPFMPAGVVPRPLGV